MCFRTAGEWSQRVACRPDSCGRGGWDRGERRDGLGSRTQSDPGLRTADVIWRSLFVAVYVEVGAHTWWRRRDSPPRWLAASCLLRVGLRGRGLRRWPAANAITLSTMYGLGCDRRRHGTHVIHGGSSWRERTRAGATGAVRSKTSRVIPKSLFIEKGGRMTTGVQPHGGMAAGSDADGRQQVADVFVVFGITDDLAKLMTFNSLYKGCSEQIDEHVFDRFADRLSCVSGEFDDVTTYRRVKNAIRDAQIPVFYVEIPPFVLDRVINGLTEAGVTRRPARMVVGKPFGHDRDSARELRRGGARALPRPCRAPAGRGRRPHDAGARRRRDGDPGVARRQHDQERAAEEVLAGYGRWHQPWKVAS